VSGTIPWRGHRRDCAYVVSPGPAPCTCDHYELQDADMVAAGLLPPKAPVTVVDDDPHDLGEGE
jgi:hypothetical protein